MVVSLVFMGESPRLYLSVLTEFRSLIMLNSIQHENIRTELILYFLK